MKNIGTTIKELPPTINNGRNSEGSFIKMDNGAIAFAYSKFHSGRGEDGDQSDLAVIFSFDNGETFGNSQVFLTAKDCGAKNLMSVSLLKMQDGTIGVFYLKKMQGLICTYCMRKTTDFVNFTNEVQCLPTDNYYVVCNDRVTRLANGNILIPACYINMQPLTQGADHGNYKNVKKSPAVAQFYISTDDGLTWAKQSQDLILPIEESKTGLQEGGVIQLADGRLYAYFRTDQGCQYQSYSSDEGKTWQEVHASKFTSPTSPMNVKKLSNGKFVIVYNPVPLIGGRSEMVDGAWTGGRNPLVLRIADENMKKPSKIMQVEFDKRFGFCYTAIFETENALLLGYCAGGGADYSTLNRLKITKILKSEIF